MASVLGLLHSQLIQKLPYPEGEYANKTVIVTGSNVGLGKEAARHYARLGVGKLILAVRSIEKGNAAVDDIKSTNKASPSVIEVLQLDMASYASVQAFAKRVEELDRVDIFVANAGVALNKWSMAEDNETTITVNVVSTFLLAALILPKMRETAKQYNSSPTFTITSSGAHTLTTFPQKTAPEGELFNTINDQKLQTKYFSEQYPLSKLLEIFAVRAIGDQDQNAVVPVNCVDPGLCHSELARDGGWGLWILKLLFARTTEYGSRTLVHAAAQGKESHGKYYRCCLVTEPSTLVTDENGRKLQTRVWNELVAKLEAIQPGVTKNFK